MFYKLAIISAAAAAITDLVRQASCCTLSFAKQDATNHKIEKMPQMIIDGFIIKKVV